MSPMQDKKESCREIDDGSAVCCLGGRQAGCWYSKTVVLLFHTKILMDTVHHATNKSLSSGTIVRAAMPHAAVLSDWSERDVLWPRTKYRAKKDLSPCWVNECFGQDSTEQYIYKLSQMKLGAPKNQTGWNGIIMRAQECPFFGRE